jgi:hypothetical protein
MNNILTAAAMTLSVAAAGHAANSGPGGASSDGSIAGGSRVLSMQHTYIPHDATVLPSQRPSYLAGNNTVFPSQRPAYLS